MKAGDIMTTGAATVGPDTSLVEAIRIMVEHRVSGLPVVNAEGKIVGIITEGDFLPVEGNRKPNPIETLTRLGQSGEALARHRVSDIMSRDPITLDIEASLDDAVQLMKTHNIKRLPVVAAGKIVGVLSRANILSALLRKAPG